MAIKKIVNKGFNQRAMITKKASKKGFMNYSELYETYNNYKMREPSTLPIQMSRKGVMRNPMRNTIRKTAAKPHFAAKFSARKNFSKRYINGVLKRGLNRRVIARAKFLNI